MRPRRPGSPLTRQWTSSDRDPGHPALTLLDTIVRTVIGLAVGILLFLFGIPVLQAVVRRYGFYDNFTYEQAVLALLLVLACIIAAQLTALRPPPANPPEQEE